MKSFSTFVAEGTARWKLVRLQAGNYHATHNGHVVGRVFHKHGHWHFKVGDKPSAGFASLHKAFEGMRDYLTSVR